MVSSMDLPVHGKPPYLGIPLTWDDLQRLWCRVVWHRCCHIMSLDRQSDVQQTIRLWVDEPIASACQSSMFSRWRRPCDFGAVCNLQGASRSGAAQQALMMRLNPSGEPCIGFAAFSAGLHGWLKEHAAALPSPAASDEPEERAPVDASDDKENVMNPSPLRELAVNQIDPQSPKCTSPGKQKLQQVHFTWA